MFFFCFFFAITRSINIQKAWYFFVDCIIYGFKANKMSEKKSRSTYDVCQVAFSFGLILFLTHSTSRVLSHRLRNKFYFYWDDKDEKKNVLCLGVQNILAFKRASECIVKEKPQKIEGSFLNRQLFCGLHFLSSFFFVFAKIKAIDH